MTRDDAVEKLRGFEPRLRRLGATSLFLFGSTARDEASSLSDLDLFMDYDPTSRFSLLDLLSAKYMIEDELHVSADVLTRSSLHPRVKPEAERDAVKVF